MQTELPRRPSAGLPPPSDGLAAARREASRRRTRRAVVAVGGAVTARVVGAVVVLVGGGKNLPGLRPAAMAPANQPTPSGAPVSTSRPVTPAGAATAHPLQSPVAANHSTAVDSAPSQHHAGGNTSQTAQSPAGQVTVTRTSGRNPGGPRVCRTGANGDNPGAGRGDNGCAVAAATATSGGDRLSYMLCRDSTTGGTLHFAG